MGLCEVDRGNDVNHYDDRNNVEHSMGTNMCLHVISIIGGSYRGNTDELEIGNEDGYRDCRQIPDVSRQGSGWGSLYAKVVKY